MCTQKKPKRASIIRQPSRGSFQFEDLILKKRFDVSILKDQTKLPENIVVMLAGLVGGKKYNGCLAAVINKSEKRKDRYHIKLIESGEEFDLKPVNLQIVVILTGLKGGKQYNGKKAAVTGKYIPKKGRYPIHIIESGAEFDVKPANLEIQSHDGDWG